MTASALYDASCGQGKPLRVGIVTSGIRVPPWVNYILSHIAASADVELIAWIIVEAPDEGPTAPPFVKFYGWLDRLVHPERLGHGTVSEPVQFGSKTPVIAFESSPESGANIRELSLDVALCLGSFKDVRSKANWARLGAWYLEFGEEAPLTWPGRAIIDRDPKTVISLKSVQIDRATPSTLFRAVGSTQGNLWCSENLHWSYLKAAGIVGRCLRQAARRDALPTDTSDQPLEQARHGPPGTVELASFLADALGRGKRYRKQARRFNEQWVLGIRHHQGSNAVPHSGGFTLIEPPDTSFYADPFLIHAYNRSWAFFEELPFDTGKGHISYMLLDDAGRPERVGRALELDYHLSYPFVFEWDGQYYMIPESSAARTVELFRAEQFPDKWVRVATLLQGYQMVDATLHREEEHWYMFVNVSETGGQVDDELFLFVAETPFGPWKPHPCNPIKSDASCARSGGPIFRAGGRLVRPSQDSIGGYGQAVVFSEILRISPTEYEDRVLGRIGPDWAPHLNGCHHYASDGRFDIIDGRRLHPKARAGVGEGAIRRET